MLLDPANSNGNLTRFNRVNVSLGSDADFGRNRWKTDRNDRKTTGYWTKRNWFPGKILCLRVVGGALSVKCNVKLPTYSNWKHHVLQNSIELGKLKVPRKWLVTQKGFYTKPEKTKNWTCRQKIEVLNCLVKYQLHLFNSYLKPSPTLVRSYNDNESRRFSKVDLDLLFSTDLLK